MLSAVPQRGDIAAKLFTEVLSLVLLSQSLNLFYINYPVYFSQNMV